MNHFSRTKTKGIIPQNNEKVIIKIPLKNGTFWEKEYNQNDNIENIINDFKEDNNEEIPEEYMEDWKYKNKSLNMDDKIKTLLVEEIPTILIEHNVKKIPLVIGNEIIPDMIGKPFNDPFEVFVFYKNDKILKMQKYENDIIEKYELDNYNSSSAYCNGDNNLFISGGENKDLEIVQSFWTINLYTQEIDKINMSGKQNHSMIFIPDNYVFIVGGNDLKTLYYDKENNEIYKWADLNKKRTEPALALISNNLYCLDNVNYKNNDEFTLEKTDITSEIQEWKLIKPNINSSNFGIPKMSQKFFGVVKSPDNNIIFLGGNMDGEENEEKYNYQYNANLNTIEYSNVPFEEYNLKEKTFLTYKENIDYILPNFNRYHPEVIFYQKDKNKLSILKYEPTHDKLRKAHKRASDSKYNFNMPSMSILKNENKIDNNKDDNNKENISINIEPQININEPEFPEIPEFKNGNIIDINPPFQPPIINANSPDKEMNINISNIVGVTNLGNDNFINQDSININNNKQEGNINNSNNVGNDSKQLSINPYLKHSEIQTGNKINSSKNDDLTNNINKLGGELNIDNPSNKLKCKNENNNNQKKDDTVNLPGSNIIVPEIKIVESKDNDDNGKFYLSGIIQGTNLDGNINIYNSNINTDTKARLNIKGPNLNTDTNNINAKGPEINGNINMNKQKIDEQNVNIKKGQEFFLTGIIPGIKPGDKEKRNIHSGKVDIGGLKQNSNDLNIDVNSPNIKLKDPNLKNISSAGGDININKDININGPNIDINNNIPEMKFTDSKVELPNANMKLKGPQLNNNLNLKGNLPSIKLDQSKNDGENPSIKIKGSKIDGEIPNLKIKEPKVDGEIPDLKNNGPTNIDEDLTYNGPKIGKNLDYYFSGIIPGTKDKTNNIKNDTNINIKNNVAGIDLKSSNLQIKGNIPEVNVNQPKIDIKGPEVNVNQPKIDIKGPETNLNGDIKGINVKGSNANISSTNINLEGPEINKNINESKLRGPNVDVNIKGDKINIPSINVESPKIKNGDLDGEINIRGENPIINENLPGVKVDGPKMELKNTNINFEESKLTSTYNFFLAGMIPSKNDQKQNIQSINTDMKISVKGPSINQYGDINLLNNNNSKLKYHGNINDINLGIDNNVKVSRGIIFNNNMNDINIGDIKMSNNNSNKFGENKIEIDGGGINLINKPTKLKNKNNEDNKVGINVDIGKLNQDNLDLDNFGKKFILDDNNDNNILLSSNNIGINMKRRGKRLPTVGDKSYNFQASKFGVAGNFNIENINTDNLQSANVGINGIKIGERIIN